MSPGPPPPILPGSSRLGEELTPDLLRVQAQAPTPNTHACTHANMKQLGCARRRTGTHRHALTFLADGLEEPGRPVTTPMSLSGAQAMEGIAENINTAH